MWTYLRRPHVDLASLILRLGLAAIFIAQGYMKLSQEESWTDQLTPTMQKVVSGAELACGVMLAVGFLSRLAALGLVAEMIGAITLVTGARGFMPVSFGPSGFTFQAGAAYNFLIIVACLALVVLGSGVVSVDYLLFGRKRGRQTQVRAVGEPHLIPSIGQSNRLTP
jgi:uncharacterized membrane protein YphA (DoxX/SURF4 family)